MAMAYKQTGGDGRVVGSCLARVASRLPLILPRRPTVALVLTVALASIGTCKATPTGKSLAVGCVRWWPPINVRVTDTDTNLAAAAIESNKGSHLQLRWDMAEIRDKI